MIKTNTIITELKNINSQFLINDKNGLKIDNKSYLYQKGEIPILLSAPHAVRQFRESQVKQSDYLTGALAIYLANYCNCSYLVRIYNDNDDPNYPLGVTLPSVDNDYLRILKEIIENYHQLLVIDLHGCRDDKKYDCSIWSDNYMTCSQDIVKTFTNNLTNNGLNVANGFDFIGGQVTRQSALLTNAFQLEIKRKIRSLKRENYYYLKTFIDSMTKSIYETYDYSKKQEKVRRRIK